MADDNGRMPDNNETAVEKTMEETAHTAETVKAEKAGDAPAEGNDDKAIEKKILKSVKVIEILEWVKSIAFALAVVLVLRTFVFQMVRVDGRSMLETLQDNDILFVTVFDRFFPENWQRGDIVICNYPNAKGYRVKRIIGLPGDTVAVKDGVTYVNGEALDEDEYIEHPAISDYEEITVPEGYYFMMGDNRAISKDSRHPSVGPIAESEIRGRVRCVVFPFSDIGLVK